MYGLSAIHEFLRDAHVAYTVVPHRPASARRRRRRRSTFRAGTGAKS